MSFRRNVLKEVGLFSTAIGARGETFRGEEAELCMRIKYQLSDSLRKIKNLIEELKEEIKTIWENHEDRYSHRCYR